MTPDVRFVPLANFSTAFEADMARERLEAEGIAVLVKGQQVGLFEPAQDWMPFSGNRRFGAGPRPVDARPQFGREPEV